MNVVGFFWISLLFQESRVILIGIPGECWPEKPYDFEFHYHMLLWKNSSRSWRISFLVCGLDASEILQHFNRNFRSKKHPALPNINNNFLFECQKKTWISIRTTKCLMYSRANVFFLLSFIKVLSSRKHASRLQALLS